MEHVSYYVHWHSSYALTEVFPCLFLSCKANARVKLEKTGHGPHSSKLVVVFVLFYVQFVCKCVLYYCHRVATQLQLTNISHHIIYPIIYHIVSYHISYRIISYHIYYIYIYIYHITSYHVSYRIIYLISYPIIYYILWYPIVYHIVSYHISYHII